MKNLSFYANSDLQALLGARLKRLRLTRDLDQRSVAEKAGISLTALRMLEAGRGSTVETLLRTLKALDALDGLDALVPEPTVNPLALMRNAKLPQRIRKKRQANPEQAGS